MLPARPRLVLFSATLTALTAVLALIVPTGIASAAGGAGLETASG